MQNCGTEQVQRHVDVQIFCPRKGAPKPKGYLAGCAGMRDRRAFQSLVISPDPGAPVAGFSATKSVSGPCLRNDVRKASIVAASAA